MKKYLKLTLFKKIFLVIFCAFLGVESFSFYLDYQIQVKYVNQEFASLVDAGSIEQTCKILKEEYNSDYNNYDFHGEMIAHRSSNYQAIVNESGKIAYSMYVTYDRRYTLSSTTANYYIEELGEKLLTQIEDYIKDNYKKNENIPFKALSYSNDDNRMLKYLKIGDIEYNTTGMEASQLETEYIMYFTTPKFEYTRYSYTTSPRVIDNEEEMEKIDRMVENKNVISKYFGSIGPVDTYYLFDENSELYIFGILEDPEGKFEFVDVNYTGVTKSDILNKTIELKGYVYISAFFVVLVISIMISYMLTRRIKKIEKTTHLIADNQFDLTLKEKPRDELGDLSHSINIMSQKLKHTMEQLNQEIERVKQLESLRKEFINQFTHEMKTPLGIINGYSELLDEAQNDEEKEKYIHLINKETEKINKLIKSMLDLSRLEANKVELQLEDIDLEDIVTEIVDEYEVLLMKKEAKVNVSAFKTHIQADKELIKTVIRNFMSNAVKHVHEKGHINICIDEGVKIYNEGEHIPDENLDTIWYTFVTHDQQGSGLGLAICQSILELHDFEYGVMNKDDGVEFYFKRR